MTRHGLNRNIRYWRCIHFSDENKSMLRHIDGRLRIWHLLGTVYEQLSIFYRGFVTGLACFSTCHVRPWRNVEKFKVQTWRLRNYVVHHFYGQNLVSHPIIKNNNTRPNRARIVQEFLQNEVTDVLPS